MLLVAAGLAVTLIGAGLAWWYEEQRRLTRLVRRALGGEADAVIVARGRNAAAGFSLAAEKMVVMRRGGAEAFLYPLEAIDGAELLIDQAVAARVHRGETRRALEKIAAEPEEVTLRLVFNDPRNPDFDLDLWSFEDEGRRHAPSPKAAIQEARSWLSRTESILRKGGSRRVAAGFPAHAEAPPWEDEEEETER